MSRYLDRAKELRASTAPPYNCAQSVVIPFATDAGLSEEHANALCANLGGGLKRAATCGAIVGGLVVLGLFGVEDAGTGVVSLFFMFESLQHPVDYLSHMGPYCGCPAPVVIAVFGVDFFIVKVFRFHMLIIRNILGERSICPAVFTD